MGIFYKNEKRDLQYSEGDSQMMVQTLLSFQGTKSRQYKDIEVIRHSDTFTAATMIASDLAYIPTRVIVNGRVNYSDRIVNLLNTRPSPVYNSYISKLVVPVSALLTSRGYIEITHDETEEPMNLAFRETSEVELKSGARGRPCYFHQRTGSNGNNIERNVKLEDMLDIKFYSSDGMNGLSLLNTLSRTTESDNNGKDFLNNLLRNDTHAGGTLKVRGVSDNKKARDHAREEFHKSFSGTKQVGKIVMLDESITFDQLEADAEVLKLIRESRSLIRKIAGIFGVPLCKFGIETVNMSIMDANLNYLSILKPYITCICVELNFKLDDGYADREFESDTTKIRVVDEKAQAEIGKINIDSGRVNIDGIRQRDGLAPIPGGNGNIHRVDLNHVNIGLVDEYQMNESRVTDRKLKDGEENEQGNGDWQHYRGTLK